MTVEAPLGDSAAVAAEVVATLALGEDVTGPAGMVPVGEPEVGVQPLVGCPELPSATQALAGRTQRWQWTGPDGRTASYSLYSAVYGGITARGVIKQARAVSGCHELLHDPSGLDRQSYTGQLFPSTKPLIDDRFGYCEREPVDFAVPVEEWLAIDHEQSCTALFAQGQKILRLVVVTGRRHAPDRPSLATLGQSLVDLIVAA
ncbi:hypothetical protein ACRAKI_12135 [Saccharothrix isguenensis]